MLSSFIMPRPPRVFYKGAYYHVFNRGVNKQPIVLDDHDRLTFMQLLGESVKICRLRLFAYCLMDNHFHLFLQTPEANLHEAMWFLQSNHARHMNLKHDRIGAFFQDRYKHRLVDTDAYALTLTRYIHHNPQDLGLDFRNYPWSSYPCYAGLLPKWPWLDTAWILNQFGSTPEKQMEAFKRFHNADASPYEKKIFDRIKIPLASREWLTRLQKGPAPF